MDDEIEGTYTPNTAPAHGPSVVEPVPTLMVVFRCPRCEAVSTLDAYRGMPKCSGGGMVVNKEPERLSSVPRHPPTRMEAVRLA